MEEPKLNVEDIQEQDLINIEKKGYSNNLIIANDSDKGYIITEFIDEKELGF
jgi:hypothetical protein